LLPAPAVSGIFPTLFCESFLRCLSPYPGGWLSAFAWFFLSLHRPSPSFDRVGFPASFREYDFHRSAYEAAAISLCSGLPFCSPPRSFLPLQVSLQGSRGFYIRADRASLPSHASDMLSARLQAIGGTRTFTSQDSQPCRLLTNDADVSSVPLSGAREVFQLLLRVFATVIVEQPEHLTEPLSRKVELPITSGRLHMCAMSKCLSLVR
jgi:hypothetical protein